MRKMAWATGLSVVLVSVVVLAQQDSTFEQITVAGTAVGITSTVTNPSGRQQMNYCEAQLETAQIRFRDDGTSPTASVGTLLEVGDLLPIVGNAYARRIRFIRTGGVSGQLNVRCYEAKP